ncbi:unnamed protein product [Rhizophagus irregularis]|nr:unnamed protein product [Rhizophagus irregularis]CAB5372980.1 unnamed protein product [Rhizophagus irregularis]
MANAKKKQKTIIKELQTNALTISSEEYIERSQGVRSIIARGPLINANSSTEASLNRIRSRRDYSESIFNSSEEEVHVDDETHKISKRKVGNDSEGLQESTEDDLYFVSEHVPCFGLDFNEGLNQRVNREILEIYNNAEQCDPIKMGVINLEDFKKNRTRAFKVISEMICFGRFWCKRLFHVFTSYFSLDESYFKQSLSENHIASITHVPIFMNLFRSKNYLVNINSVLIANKDRRNSENDLRTRLGLIPDIKLIYSKRNVEIMVVEHAKNTSKIERGNYIKEIEVYGVITSKLEVQVYVMHLSAPELYVFYKIFSYELPKTVYDFDVLRNALRCLIRFRKIVDNNFQRYNSILRNEPLTPTQQIQWVVKVKNSPRSINEELKAKRRKESSSRKQTAIKKNTNGRG